MDATNDMLRLENQIPLEVIRNALVLFFKITKQKQEYGNQTLASGASSREIGDAETQAHKLLQHICVCVASAYDHELPGSIWATSVSEVKAKLNFNTCEHFLHCVYLGMTSERSEQGTLAAFTNASADPTESASESNSGNSGNLSRNWSGNTSHNLPSSIQSEKRTDAAPHLLWGAAQALVHCCFNRRKRPFQNASIRRATTIFDNRFTPLASASSLRKAGINFRGTTGLEAQFKKHLLGATLYLSRIHYLGDSAEGTWRNLSTFEATWRNLLAEHEDQQGFQHPFMSYLVFMDELIDLEEDVALLRHGRNPVIGYVGVGSNAEVARIFNSMITDHCNHPNDKWNGVRGQVLDYYNNKSRQTWVEFRRTKFGKPWLFASFMAAVALLVLTFLQTLFAILTYKYTF